ncbi:hypothetical protein [Urechidicola croceus]|uniref:Uncharacterized protein n=1 Tax=Urechidicola croceus TaxID=1850246 RepID=A0A1D8P8B1_9FLAO|nr:hypothetical protein [Urechidicola croceus]AOW20807.1 hypothetical protein LPB138_09015 [Urechidicola croceus]
MKKNTILFFSILLLSQFGFTQTNQELADAYVRRSEESLNSLKVDDALKNFEKAIKYTPEIKSEKVAYLGLVIYFELGNYSEAKKYSKRFFDLSLNKSSQEYTQALDLYIKIEEELERLELERQRLEEARIRKEKELRKIDSLKTVWTARSLELAINCDTIYNFTENKYALYKNQEKYGLVDEIGKIIVDASEFNYADFFDGYFIFSDKKVNPSKVFFFNSKSDNSFSFPEISKFDLIASNYGVIMLPRGNGRVVIYPKNSKKAKIFDLESQKIVSIANEKELLKELKSNAFIDKYDKEGEVRIGKKWFIFGSYLGGGLYQLYQKEEGLFYYLSTSKNKLFSEKELGYVGVSYNGKSQIIKRGVTSWINESGDVVNPPKNELSEYSGSSKIIKIEEGKYQIRQQIGTEEYIILEDEKLESMVKFLRQNN